MVIPLFHGSILNGVWIGYQVNLIAAKITLFSDIWLMMIILISSAIIIRMLREYVIVIVWLTLILYFSVLALL